MLKKFLHALTFALMSKKKKPRAPKAFGVYAETEIEQVVDEARADVGKGPAPRSPQAGIRDMQARIAYHTTLAGKLQMQLENAAPDRLPEIRRLISTSERQFTEAKRRLREYQLQAKSQN